MFVMQPINILVSDAHGVYVPMQFIKSHDLSLWNGIDQEDVDTIMKGPDDEYYWDSWSNILQSATYQHGGDQYFLYQDGDVFAICYDNLSEKEYYDFFGENRVDYRHMTEVMINENIQL